LVQSRRATVPLLRPLTPSDLPDLVEVYRDAVLSQTASLYAPGQVEAWAEHAGRSGALEQPLTAGYGVASLHTDQASIEAFGILYPADRLALLYCRGRSCRQGRAGAILDTLERHARQRGVQRLRTEASQLSRPLLERRGWLVEAEETVLFAGAWFRRWRMITSLETAGPQSLAGSSGTAA
jgi:putative acetyltransferase